MFVLFVSFEIHFAVEPNSATFRKCCICRNLHRHQIRISSSATGGIRGFHSSSFASFISHAGVEPSSRGYQRLANYWVWFTCFSGKRRWVCHAFALADAILPCSLWISLWLTYNIILASSSSSTLFCFHIAEHQTAWALSCAGHRRWEV